MMEDLIKAYEDRGVKFWVENGQLEEKGQRLPVRYLKREYM